MRRVVSKLTGGLFRSSFFRPNIRPQPPSINIELCIKDFFDNYVLNQSESQFRVVIDKSRLCNAGNGVMVHGYVPKHHIVSFYPGYYKPPPPTYSIISPSGDTCVKPGEVESVQSIYRISCPTVGGTIDATNYPRPSLPFCVGDIINHPPSGTIPNVYPLDFSWKSVLEASKQWS